MISLLIKLGVASNERGAMKIMLGIVVVCLVLSVAIVLWTLKSSTSKSSEGSHLQIHMQRPQ